ncbi:MAG: hypothetical protein P8J50_11165 [Acidimicrobiales bacterium]|nr:hypothetical protein [Acidimicrobiales bacterium]
MSDGTHGRDLRCIYGDPADRREYSRSLLEGILKPALPQAVRLKLPFVIAGFCSFLFSVWLYFVQDETTAGIFVGLWVPSIHSLGTLLLVNVDEPARRESGAVQS